MRAFLEISGTEDATGSEQASRPPVGQSLAHGMSDSAPPPLPAGDSPYPRPNASATAANAEAELVDAARRVLRSNPTEALELTRRHESEFPKGQARIEGAVIAIEALALLGRSAEARARYEAFARAYPQSLHLPRLRRSLGIPRDDE